MMHQKVRTLHNPTKQLNDKMWGDNCVSGGKHRKGQLFANVIHTKMKKYWRIFIQFPSPKTPLKS